jgi:hypothetical protein
MPPKIKPIQRGKSDKTIFPILVNLTARLRIAEGSGDFVIVFPSDAGQRF